MQTDPRPALDHDAVNFAAEIIGGLTAGLAERPGDNGARRKSYARALTFCFTAFRPRDVEELISGDSCLLFHHVLRDAAFDLEEEPDRLLRLRIRPQVNASGKISLSQQHEFDRLRGRKPAQIVVRFPDSMAADPAMPGASDEDEDDAPAATGADSEAAARHARLFAEAEQLVSDFVLLSPAEMAEQGPDASLVLADLLCESFAIRPKIQAPASASGGAPIGKMPATGPAMPARPEPPADASPEPFASPRPVNRAQRRLAIKLERTKARRAAASSQRAPADTGPPRSA
jgi:hypothetical protein